MAIPSLANIPELIPVEPGEYQLYIRVAKDIRNNDNTRDGIMLTIDILEVENAATVFDNMWIPNSTDSEETAATMWQMLRQRIVALGLDPDEETPANAFVGINFSGYLDLDEYNGVTKNILKKITG